MSVLKVLLTFILISSFLTTVSQSSKSPVSRIINVPATTQIAPSLSGDGRHMIFTTTSNLKSELKVFYSFQQHPGNWTQPEPVEVINRSLQINHIGGYSLSYDGNYIFFTSRKSYGIGKYDIWYCKKTGANQWSAPLNLAKPVNSTLDDGCPSISPDGKTLYFVRCQSMDLKEGTGCKLMMAVKKNQDYWGEPVTLPEYINDGNIMSPKILADNQTLIYAKGQGDDWDLYQTRLVSGEWTKPLPLDYVNTSADERFASVPAWGNTIYYSAKFKGTYDIIMARIPEAMQPLKVVYLTGQITGQQGEPMETFIQVYDVNEKELVQYLRTTDKNAGFEFYLTAGRQYDFSIVPLAPKYTFYSEIIDLKELTESTRKTLNVSLENLDPGITFPLNCLQFDNDSTLSPVSRFELSRLIKLLKNNSGTPVEIAVHREPWEPDSVVYTDSLANTDSLAKQVDILPDTSLVEEPLITQSSLHSVDSLQLPEEALIQPAPPPDPTEIQAETIEKYLYERGVPDYILQATGYADTQPVVSGDQEEQSPQNRRVEVRIL